MIIPIELRFKADKDSKSAFRTEKTIKSHDVNSVEFHITIEGLELTGNHTAKILSMFHSSKSQANVDCEIVEGEIIYKPDTNLITRHEHVTNYVYVYNNNQSLDVREFIYVVDLSKIDETSLEVKEVYDQSYADLLADFEQALSDYKDNLPQADSVRAEIDVVLNQFEVDSQNAIGDLNDVSAAVEVAEASRINAEQARKEAETLREESYEQKVDTAIVEADVVEKVDNKVTELTPRMNDLTAQLAQKAPKDETQLALIALDAKIDGQVAPDPVIIENLWVVEELEEGLLSTTSGNLNPSSSMKTTPFKDIIPEQNYSFSATPTLTGINFRFVFYDENNVFISSESGALSESDGWHQIIKTPPNAVKGRISAPASTEDIFVANIGDEPIGENEGDIWDGGFWEGIPTPPLRDGSVRENHLSPELWEKIESGGGSGDGGTGGDLGEQHIYDDSSVYSSGQEKVIADIGAKAEVDLIEFSSNGILSELQIFYKENDGTEFLYDLISNNGTDSVPNTFGNMQTHGSSIVDFIEFDDRNNVFKVAARNLKFANGFKITTKNNSDSNQNISVRVVSRQYV